MTGWVGDSRAYWLPDEDLSLALNEDDTAEQEALAAWLGADADQPTPRLRSYQPPTPGCLCCAPVACGRYLPDAESLRAGLAQRPTCKSQAVIIRAKSAPIAR